MSAILPFDESLCEKADQVQEGVTPGKWLAGSWYGVCHIEEHGRRHPGPPACKYDPAFGDGGGDYQSETCAARHDHGALAPICESVAALAGALEQQ